MTFSQVEGPTGYMLAEYTAFYTIDVNTGALTPTDNTHPAELPVPLVFSTPDRSAAMGAMASPATDKSFSVRYAKYNFAEMQPFDNGTTKWSNVFRSGPHKKVCCAHSAAIPAVGSCSYSPCAFPV